MNVLNEQTVRLINTLSKHFCNNREVYNLNVDRGAIKIQAVYSARLVYFLQKKQFNIEVCKENGYLYLSKHIGLIDVKFVLTD